MGEYAEDAFDRDFDNWCQSIEDLFLHDDYYDTSSYIVTYKKVNREIGDSCPKCSGQLVIRINKLNQIRFLGCSNFPKCRFSTNI